MKNIGFLGAAILAANFVVNPPIAVASDNAVSCPSLFKMIEDTRGKLNKILNMRGELIFEETEKGVRVFPKGSNKEGSSITLNLFDALNTLDAIDQNTRESLRQRVPGLVEKMEDAREKFSNLGRDMGMPSLPNKYRHTIGICLSV